MLPHGGRLRAAAERYGIPLADWLDLSTGINPHGWPVPAIPPSAWARLPEDDDGLEQAARTYYGTDSLLAVAGSQAAIQTLPRLRPRGSVGVIAPGYNEHAHVWQRAGHTVTPVSADTLDSAAADMDVLVIIHPNNPTGAWFSTETLLQWHAQLAARGGWLVVDEAFIDATPEQSLAPYCPRLGLIVLRSLGKFFGLAGARVGFAIAEPALLESLKSSLGPWPIAAPSRHVAMQALADRDWQEAVRRRLIHHGERLAALLTQYGLAPSGGCALFQWVCTPQSIALHEQLARDGILTRLFDAPASLRFGLPNVETEWAKLAVALTAVHHPEANRAAR
ncbi:MAG: threonine-phosphate decarboxylase [Gammaproteobacteria bacterium]|nr:threonine-phosphate decarboxylase [Gammaproteobacteria bacterium]